MKEIMLGNKTIEQYKSKIDERICKNLFFLIDFNSEIIIRYLNLSLSK